MGDAAGMPNHQIFVSIASYRDPQLVPTIADCIAKASDPDGLRFGICLQRDAADEAFPYMDDPRFRVLSVDWRESRGACWARAEIMKLWQGEDWYMQVDSHCRFAQGWDEKLLRGVLQTGSEKPILSTYGTAFKPAQSEDEAEYLAHCPQQIGILSFTREGLPQLVPLPLAGNPLAPVPARFLAAGFLFTLGDFVDEVPYDPELYFMGEEIAMTVRAFTHGYDLFHPAVTVVWHDYIRADAKKHWGDHVASAPVGRVWSDLDAASRTKVLRLLRGEAVESYGLGPDRTVKDYEDYAGLSFRTRRVQHYTMQGAPPPNPAAPPDWTDSVHPWIAKLTVQTAELPAGSLEDPILWAVSIYDAGQVEIYRQDLNHAALEPLRGGDPEAHIVVEFYSATPPARWSISPLTRASGWLQKMSGQFEDADFALLNENDSEEQGEPQC